MSKQLFLGLVNNNNIYLAKSSDGPDWAAPIALFQGSDGKGAFQTHLPVSISAFGKKYYMAAIGTDNHVYLATSSDGTSWSMSATALFQNFSGGQPFQTIQPVSMTTFGKRLYMALVGLDNQVFLASMDSKQKWSIGNSTIFPAFNGQSPFQTKLAVSMSAFRERLYIAATGENGNIYLGSSGSGKKWSMPNQPLFPDFSKGQAFQTNASVCISPFGGTLCLSATGENKNIYLGTSYDGVNWGINSFALFQNFNSSGAFQTTLATTISTFQGTIYLTAIGLNNKIYLGSSTDTVNWAMTDSSLFQNFNNNQGFASTVAGTLFSRRVTVEPSQLDPQIVVQSRLMENYIEASPVQNLKKVKCGSYKGALYVLAQDNAGNLYKINSPAAGQPSAAGQSPWSGNKISCWESIVDFSIASTQSESYIYIMTTGHLYGPYTPNGNSINITSSTTALVTFHDGQTPINIKQGYLPGFPSQLGYAYSYMEGGPYGIFGGQRGQSPTQFLAPQFFPILDFTWSSTGASPNSSVVNFAVSFGNQNQTRVYQQNWSPNAQPSVAATYLPTAALSSCIAGTSFQLFGVDLGYNLEHLASPATSLGAASLAFASNLYLPNNSAHGAITVYSVASNGSLCHTYSNGRNYSSWTRMIPLGGDFGRQKEQLGVCFASDTLQPHIFAIGASKGELYHVWQDPNTSDWRLEPVDVNYEPELIQFASYVTQIGLVTKTDSRPLPLPGQELRIMASDYVDVSINGKMYTLDQNTPAYCKTDALGLVTITTETRALSTASLSVSSPEFPYLPTVTIQPEAYLEDVLGHPQNANDLATMLTNARTRVTNQKVINADATTIDAVAQAMYQCITFLKSQKSDAKAAAQFISPTSQTAGVHILPEDEWPDEIDLSQIPDQHWAIHFDNGGASFESLTADAVSTSSCAKGQPGPKWSWGDLWNSIKRGLSHVACILVSKTESGLQVIINFVSGKVNKVISYVVEKTQQVWDIVEGVLESIGTTFKTIFEWLGSIFNWQDILLTQQCLAIALQHFMQYLDTWTSGLKTKMDTFFQNTETMLKQDWKQLLGSYGNQKLVSIQQTATGGKKGPELGPHANWLMNQMVSMNSSGLFPPIPFPSSYKQSAEQFTQGLEAEFKKNQTGQALSGLCNQTFEKGIKNLTLNDYAVMIGDAAIQQGLGVINSYVDSSIDYITNGVKDFNSTIQQEYTVPLISPLYQSLTGKPMTLLDLFCLMVAIPTTIEYKTAMAGLSVVGGAPERPQGPFTAEDLCILQHLTPGQLYGGQPIDWKQIRSACSTTNAVATQQPTDESTYDAASPQAMKIAARIAGALLAADGFLLLVNGAVLAINDFARQPLLNLIQQGLMVLSAAFTFPLPQLDSNGDVHNAKLGLWGSKLSFVVFNVGAMLLLTEAMVVVYPIMAFVEGAITVGYSVYLAHVQGGRSHYASLSSIQNYMSTTLQLTAPFRFLLVLVIETGDPISKAGALIGLGIIYLVGVGSVFVCEQIQATELLTKKFGDDDILALPQHAG